MRPKTLAELTAEMYFLAALYVSLRIAALHNHYHHDTDN